MEGDWVAGDGAAGAGALAPVAIGSVLMVMVYAGGHISGAHYNPAVTLAIMIRGKTTAGELAAYWAAQIAGAVLAAVASCGREEPPVAHPPKRASAISRPSSAPPWL